MIKNAKFHATAISIIIAVVIVLYMLIGPSTAPQQDANAPLPENARYIRIASATWGKNCNPTIADELVARSSKPPAKDEKGNIIQQKQLMHVAADNVLSQVKSLCDGKLTCEVPATVAAMAGVDPLESCFKRLAINYRCARLDAVSSKEVDQEQSIQIDCSADPQNATAHDATHP